MKKEKKEMQEESFVSRRLGDQAEDRVLLRLQELSESQLTTSVLIPLLRSFGFDKVEYHGGSYEEGKDLICWRTDELGDTELAVAQVKRYQPTVKSADKRSFAEIVTQLQQASESAVPNTDGHKYHPSMLYFITPFPLETRALQSRFEGYSSLRKRRVKIIDGPLLLKLIKTNLPNIAEELSGSESLMRAAIVKTLTNADLLSALSIKLFPDISAFYCDLDFGVGRISTRFLFSLNLRPVKRQLSLTSAEWTLFRTRCETAESSFGLKLISPSCAKIEQNYDIQTKDRANKIKLSSELSAAIESNLLILHQIEELLHERHQLYHPPTRGGAAASLGKCYKDVISRLSSGRKKAQKRQCMNSSKLASFQSLVLKDCALIEAHELNFSGKSETAEAVANYLRVLKKAMALISKKVNVAKKTTAPTYGFIINGHPLATCLKERQEWLSLSIEALNKGESQPSQLKQFIDECEQLFKQVEEILEDRHIAESVGLLKEQRYASMAKFKRIGLSIHSIFDTGRNIAVLGEAGAGKTTSLQMYAKRRLENGLESEITIFAPLPQVIAALSLEVISSQSESPTVKLELGIVAYLCTLGLHTTPNMLLDMFKQKRVVLLLDGIDEAIKRTPWLLEAIAGLSERYPQAQIIITSRMSGEYLDKIPFFGITLLPFTDAQRKLFIESWFGRRCEELITRILEHLNRYPDLSDIIRNPLLATILCVLAEHDVPLPDSEVRLYEERMRLLLGQYDIHKKAVRLNSHPHHLELVARKLGYLLHRAYIRYASIDDLTQRAVGALRDKMDDTKVVMAIKELIDPCNVLVPMTDDGQFGFGHLRFQEYLAASELRTNRGIPVGPLMFQSWWRGAVTLFAQMTDEIEFLIDWVVKRGKVSDAYETICSMLAIRPIQERAALSKILEGHLELDQIEDSGMPYFPEKSGEMGRQTVSLLKAFDFDVYSDFE